MARKAKSLNQLLKQVNDLFPNRSKRSDGWIGDTKHAARKSDHNPNKAGVVNAIDITHDPAHGLVIQQLANALVKARDPRLSYIICNGKIISSTTSPWKWRKYSGANPHDKHIHISVNAKGDDAAPWALPLAVDPVKASSPVVVDDPKLKKGSKGPAVTRLQKLLAGAGEAISSFDGVFGPATEKAVKAFQTRKKLVSDGIVGAYTWDALEAAQPKPSSPAAPQPVAAPKTVTVEDAGKQMKAGIAGSIITGVGGAILREVFDQVLNKQANDPDMPITRRNVPELTDALVEAALPAIEKKVAPKVQQEVDAVIENATNQEPLVQSRVIQGTTVALVMVLGWVGIEVTGAEVTEVIEAGMAVVAAAGTIWAIVGRVRAGLKPVGK